MVATRKNDSVTNTESEIFIVGDRRYELVVTYVAHGTVDYFAGACTKGFGLTFAGGGQGEKPEGSGVSLPPSGAPGTAFDSKHVDQACMAPCQFKRYSNFRNYKITGIEVVNYGDYLRGQKSGVKLPDNPELAKKQIDDMAKAGEFEEGRAAKLKIIYDNVLKMDMENDKKKQLDYLSPGVFAQKCEGDSCMCSLPYDSKGTPAGTVTLRDSMLSKLAKGPVAYGFVVRYEGVVDATLISGQCKPMPAPEEGDYFFRPNRGF